MNKMTITTARGTVVTIEGDHNVGVIYASLPSGRRFLAGLGTHPVHGNVLSDNTGNARFADVIVPLNDAQLVEVREFAEAVRAASCADRSTYAGANHAYETNYARVMRAMRG